jgi:hypothetical protein
MRPFVARGARRDGLVTLPLRAAAIAPDYTLRRLRLGSFGMPNLTLAVFAMMLVLVVHAALLAYD